MGFNVTETTFRAGGSSSRSATGRKAKRTFIVEYEADTPPESLAEVETADDGTTSIPAIGDPIDETDSDRLAVLITVRPRNDTGLLFDVEVDYETREQGEIDENPLNAPVEYDWDFSASSQPYFKDESDEPKLVTTSAGEPFEKLLEREVGEVVVTITRNIEPEDWDPETAASFMFPATAVNDDTITIEGTTVAAGQARFAGVRCSGIKKSNGVQYRTRVITLKLRSSWDDVVEDRGFFEKDSANPGKLKEINAGTPPGKPEKPWPLDGSGAAKANAADAPAELTFVPYPSMDFSVWGIT